MDEPRKILEFSVSHKDVDTFIEKNKGMLISEIIAASEELLYCNLESVTVYKIRIKQSSEKVILECKLRLVDIIRDLDNLLNWTIQKEEYELSHRLKLLDEYIKSNNITDTIDTNTEYESLYTIV
jgi:hypothetical protein